MNELLNSITAVLQTTPERWIALAHSLPSDLFARAPAQGEWSALECLLHLMDTERCVFPVRTQHLLLEEAFPAFDPGAQGTQVEGATDAYALAREFADMRQGSLRQLYRIDESDLDKRARHQELGMVSLRQMLNEWAAHDLMHTVQAERAMMQPFIRGSGPWRDTFYQHDAGNPVRD